MTKPMKTLTDEQIIQVEALAAYLSQEQIADYLGVGKTTWYEIVKRQPEVSERYKKGKAKAVGSIAQSLIEKAKNGDTASIIFYLKTQAGWRETQNLNHSSEDGSIAMPTVIKLVSDDDNTDKTS
jgi:IS30 family transposase